MDSESYLEVRDTAGTVTRGDTVWPSCPAHSPPGVAPRGRPRSLQGGGGWSQTPCSCRAELGSASGTTGLPLHDRGPSRAPCWGQCLEEAEFCPGLGSSGLLLREIPFSPGAVPFPSPWM